MFVTIVSALELEKFAHRRILASASRVPYIVIYARSMICKDVSGKPRKPRRDARNHIAFNGISRIHNTPALEIAWKYLFSLVLSFSHPYTAAPLGIVPRITLAHPHSRSFLLCFAITLRATQSRLPNIHRLLILLTVCTDSKPVLYV